VQDFPPQRRKGRKEFAQHQTFLQSGFDYLFIILKLECLHNPTVDTLFETNLQVLYFRQTLLALPSQPNRGSSYIASAL